MKKIRTLWEISIREYSIEMVAAVLTLLAGLTVYVFSALRFPNDDQFILFRYIDLIAGGQGFVYNLGDKVLGSTTPLFTLVASFFKTLLPMVSTPDLVAGLNIAFLSASAVFFSLIAKRFLSKPFHILAVAVFALNLARTIPEGMETPLFLLATFAFLHFLISGRNILAAIALALSILTRPDAGLIAVIAFVYWIIQFGWLRTVRYTIISVAVALPWFIFATLYFGSFVPQSLATKLHSSDIYSIPDFQAVKVQAAHISRIWWGRVLDFTQIPLQIVFNFLPVVLVSLVGARSLARKHPALFVLIVTPFVYFVSFAISNPVVFPWYLSEMEPFWILLFVAGVERLLQGQSSKILVAIIATLLLVGPLTGFLSLATSSDAGSKGGFFEAGNYLKARLEPGDRIGLTDIGIVGYVTGAPIIDFIGLVSPDSVAHYPVDEKCVLPGVIHTLPLSLLQATFPEWVVITEHQITPCVIHSAWFLESYELVHETGQGSQRIYRAVKP